MIIAPEVKITLDFGRGPGRWRVGFTLNGGDKQIQSVMRAHGAGNDILSELTNDELRRIEDAVFKGDQ